MDIELPKELEEELASLEREVARLAGVIKRLREEKTLLAERLNTLNAERAQLLNKNAMVQNRVEAMITRLKTMEQAP